MIRSKRSKPVSHLKVLFHTPSTMPTAEEWAPALSEAVRGVLSSDISESKPIGTYNPIWYDVSLRNVPYQASFSVNFERFTKKRFFPIFPKMSNSGSPPAKPGVYSNCKLSFEGIVARAMEVFDSKMLFDPFEE